ncbi:alpha/beta fold hydrolase [Sphingomonas rubra]|uniref:Pimeloyl-ACP methyl ester carboxylesterase n=1 Tax=Sphingomonas rubra TaxID=634430 RepID=A0A1I5R6R2_9SPHN|nr:alpha/beta hydrolase [Sphingomonas rubra]SFP54080.1 Pimeloyl-ACP methyl ester carboxylesterase [Sphingomonas rubra]
MRISERTVVFLRHALGGSARSFDLVRERLPEVETIAVDLPGFGQAVGVEGYSVAAMVDHVAGVVAARAPARWMVVGHSMGGKVATLLARTAVTDPALASLAGVVLLAASPPSPEPIEEGRRDRMIGWVADGPIADADARRYVDANSAARLPVPVFATAVAEARRSSRRAWRAWLEHGSREDMREAAGVLPYPALIVAGAKDGDLGEAAQRRLNVPHYVDATVEVVPGAAHLPPLEAPDAVAALIARHVEACRAM